MIIALLAWLTLFALILIAVLFSSLPFTSHRKVKWIWTTITRYRNQLSFIVALTATLGSLYLSEIADLNPCKLCWVQRIFMYPLVILFGMAWLKKDKSIRWYAIPLASIGAVFAGYHYYIQKAAVTCSLDGTCSTPFFFHFGFISIPMMALAAFILIILLNRGPK